MNDIDEIREKMLRHMDEEGISKSDLARRLGVSRATVTNFFNRPRVDLSYSNLRAYCRALGIKMDLK